jgi:precorrin-3B methylase
VISGYYLDSAEIIRGRPARLASNAPQNYANVNSGFIIAYDIAHAVYAIKKRTHRPDTANEVIPSCNMVQGALGTLAFLGAMVTWYL